MGGEIVFVCRCCLFFQAEDGIRDLVRSRGLGDVYKRQAVVDASRRRFTGADSPGGQRTGRGRNGCSHC